jgi:Glycosyl transferase family 2
MASLSIIVPTVGRPTLVGTLTSIATQLRPGDELLVACNTDGNYGDRSIDRCQAKAEGDIVLFCDDDDVYTEGALDRIRAWASQNPGKIGLFRRGFNNGAAQWRRPELKPGNVQRMCIALPNVPGKMPRWTGYTTEVDIPVEAAKLQDAEIVFVDDVIGLARPFEVGLARRLRYRLRLGTRLRVLLGAKEEDVLHA